MRNLLNFLVKHHFLLLFVLLEAVSFLFLAQSNYYQRARIFNYAYEITGNLNQRYANFLEYLSLKEENEKLARENAELKAVLFSSYKTDTVFSRVKIDSLRKQQYSYVVAKVIKNSINQQNNIMILDKGRKHGIKKEMGVICPTGVVGIVKDVSENFCSVISMLNSNLHVSSKIKRNNYFGATAWDGANYKQVQLTEIPVHIRVFRTDTIVTSGFSSIFPEGLLVGRVKDYTFKGGDNFYSMTLTLSTDFKNLKYVYVINNLLKEEIKTLDIQEK